TRRVYVYVFFFFSSRRRHTRCYRDWSSDVCSSDLAFGQHLGEFSANYSYMHYVPVDNLPTINLNGGGGAAVLYFAGFFGIKAEFEGYASENVNFSFPPGSARCPSGCTGTAEANLITANVGPTIKIRIKGFQPFFEGLVGGAHTNYYQNVHKNCVGCV